MTALETLNKKKSPVRAIAETLQALYQSEYFNNFQKSLIVNAIAEALKECHPEFNEDKFKEFVLGK
jgi:two-component sensor histidine kinase